MLILKRNPWKFVFIWNSNRPKLPFFPNFLNAHAPVIDYAQLFSHRTPEVVVPLLLETKRRQICVNNLKERHAEEEIELKDDENIFHFELRRASKGRLWIGFGINEWIDSSFLPSSVSHRGFESNFVLQLLWSLKQQRLWLDTRRFHWNSKKIVSIAALN